MYIVYICGMFAISTILEDAAYGLWDCSMTNVYALRNCTDPSGVKYFVSGQDRYDLDTLQQFCSSDSATGVSHCIRRLYVNCELPEDIVRGFNLVADMIEHGLESACVVGIADIMAGRGCITRNMGAIDHCVHSRADAYFIQPSQQRPIEEMWSTNLSPERMCPLADAIGSCISDVVGPCDQRAAAALYNLEAAPPGICSQTELQPFDPHEF